MKTKAISFLRNLLSFGKEKEKVENVVVISESLRRAKLFEELSEIVFKRHGKTVLDMTQKTKENKYLLKALTLLSKSSLKEGVLCAALEWSDNEYALENLLKLAERKFDRKTVKKAIKEGTTWNKLNDILGRILFRGTLDDVRENLQVYMDNHDAFNSIEYYQNDLAVRFKEIM